MIGLPALDSLLLPLRLESDSSCTGTSPWYAAHCDADLNGQLPIITTIYLETTGPIPGIDCKRA